METLRGIKAIAFDTDSTLVDFDKVMRHSQQIALNELSRQRNTDGLDIDTMVSIRGETAQDPAFANATLEDIRLESFRRIIAVTGEPDEPLAAHLYRLYMKHRYEDIELYDDVLPVLSELKKYYVIGIHSNGNSYPDMCGLDGLFDFIVFAPDHGVKKPDPRFYDIVLQKAGCAAGELLNIGDSLHNDVQAAQECGIRSLWLNRDFQTPSPDTGTIHEIHSLTELPGLLDR